MILELFGVVAWAVMKARFDICPGTESREPLYSVIEAMLMEDYMLLAGPPHE